MFWRRRLPHWVPEDSIVFVTWRLAGTMPSPEPKLLINQPDPGTRFVIEDRALDRARTGPQWLKDPRIALTLAKALLYGEAQRSYELYAWVVMPNHVHVVLKPNRPLPQIIRWLKTATAARANHIIGVKAPFWRREYFDHWIRTEKELRSVIRYVEWNPVTAGLATLPEEFPWSSAAKDKTTGGKTAGVT